MKPQFSLSGSLVNAVQFPDWRTVQLTLNVLDRSGVYTLVNASVGDIILIDASAYDVGLITSYLITDIVSRNVTTLIVTAVCELSEAPDLGWCIGSNVMITKNTSGIRATPAPGVQGIQDSLSFASIESNFNSIKELIVVSTSPPDNNDGRRDGTLYIHLLT